jgi:hypothetical protein
LSKVDAGKKSNILISVESVIDVTQTMNKRDKRKMPTLLSNAMWARL